MEPYDLARLVAWVEAGPPKQRRYFSLDVTYLLSGKVFHRCRLSFNDDGVDFACLKIADTVEAAIEMSFRALTRYTTKWS